MVGLLVIFIGPITLLFGVFCFFNILSLRYMGLAFGENEEELCMLMHHAENKNRNILIQLNMYVFGSV